MRSWPYRPPAPTRGSGTGCWPDTIKTPPKARVAQASTDSAGSRLAPEAVKAVLFDAEADKPDLLDDKGIDVVQGRGPALTDMNERGRHDLTGSRAKEIIDPGAAVCGHALRLKAAFWPGSAGPST